MRREAEEEDHRRDVDDAAADPQDAGEEADEDAEDDPVAQIEGVGEVDAARVGQRAAHPAPRQRPAVRRAQLRLRGVRSQVEEDRQDDQQAAEEDPEGRRGEVGGDLRAEQCARDRRRREAPGGLVVDPPLPHEGDRAGDRADEDDRQRGAGRLLGREAEQEQQDRHDDEAAPGPDQRAVGADQQPDQHEFDDQLRRHATPSRTWNVERGMRNGHAPPSRRSRDYTPLPPAAGLRIGWALFRVQVMRTTRPPVSAGRSRPARRKTANGVPAAAQTSS